MTVARACWVSILVWVLSGCSQGPVPLARVGAIQEALSSAAHWQILARETAIKTAGCLAGLSYYSYETDSYLPYCLQDTSEVRDLPLTIEMVDSGMPFARAFHGLLTTEMMDQGLKVLHDPGSERALTVRYRVQLLPRTEKVPLNSVPGVYSWLGFGVWAVVESSLSSIVALGALTDAVVAGNDYGGAQVIVTISVMDGERFVMRKSDGYFVADADLGHYASTLPAPELLPGRKSGAAAPESRDFGLVVD
ncbi:MAG: hypothetical protein QF926_16260 [Alphaproteobacteria bacterium]|jgi:hypothetical protein|nr:hypothetical protein [Alphaproteobacteria bacterium]MDP6518158.1 hypothetical protein [Alphaproteobacteria bacterium]